ncbi:MAG: hypothetical protein C6W57_06950 [Caldibacillus debilis]|nr:MAG: hypothetical protein C6W57_06950 [Caldibacillus debilis]
MAAGREDRGTVDLYFFKKFHFKGKEKGGRQGNMAWPSFFCMAADHSARKPGGAGGVPFRRAAPLLSRLSSLIGDLPV